MKRILARFVFLLLAMALACACTGFQNNRLGTLSVQLRVENGLESAKSLVPARNAHAKSITPAEGWSPSHFVLSGTGPGGAVFSLDSAGISVEEKLVPGEWTIAVHALSAGDKEVAFGESSCLLQPGRTTDTWIILYPLEGMGDLSVAISANLEVPSGSRLTGNLTYKGLPGHPAPTTQTVLPIEIPAAQSSLSFEDLPAGHYALTLKMIASDGIVSGGCADTVLVMAGFLSSGTCTIEMGMPLGAFFTDLYPASPLPPPLVSVKHTASASHVMIPLAIPRYLPAAGEAMERKWYSNGEAVGDAARLTGNLGLLPAGSLAFPPESCSAFVSLMRFDLVEESKTSFRTGSTSVVLDSAYGNDYENCGWRASYDFSSALSPSLHEMPSLNGTGTGRSYPARAVSASSSGLIVVSGLDEEGALHAFAAGYGAELEPSSSAGASVLPIDASWIRLWRDRTKIGSTYRTADRLAVSDDGRFFAAASSSSDWLRISCVDANGGLLDTFSLASTASGTLTDMKNLRALRFSADGRKLYVAANTGGIIYAFDVDEYGIDLASSITLSRPAGTSTLSLQDIEVTNSGAIVVTAAEISRIYILADEGGLAETGFIQGSSGGTDPCKPGSLAIPAEGDAFHVLCDSEKILTFVRPDCLSPYSLATSFVLPPEAEGAFLMDAGKSLAGDSEMIFVAGGEEAEFFEVGNGGSIVASRPIYAGTCSPLGLSTATGLCFTRGAFVLSGGTTGLVSVFGAD